MRTCRTTGYCRVAVVLTIGTLIYWLPKYTELHRDNDVQKVPEMEFHVGPNVKPTKHQGNTRAMMIENTQLERQALLQKQCSDNNTLSLYTKKHIYVEDVHGLMYCVIPKTGCSNWKRILMVLNGRKENVNGLTSNEVHRQTYVYIPLLSSFNRTKQSEILYNYTKFVFVRQPFRRLLSAYRNKFENTKYYRAHRPYHRYGKHIIKERRENPTQHDLQTGEGVTWTEFVDYLIHVTERKRFEPEYDYINVHWRTMNKLCSPCSLQYDFIGKLEEVTDESKYLLDKLKVSDKVKYLSPTNSHPTNSSSETTYNKYFSMLDQKQILGLWQIYKIDFLLFGYDKPDFVP